MKAKLSLGTLVLLFISCTLSSMQIEIQRAEKAEENKNYKEAAYHYARAMKREPRTKLAYYAAKKLANISIIHLDDVNQAQMALNYIILNTSNITDKKTSIERLAKIQYEKKQNYENAIVEFQRLLELEKEETKILDIRSYIASSYFFMNRLYQAKQELRPILELELNEANKDYLFKAEMMRANIYHAEKDYEQAAKYYRDIIERYPKMALKEKVWLNLSVCYEDMKRFKDAVTLLENINLDKNDKIFVEQKIVRLKERMDQEPGARGLRR